MVVPSPLQTLVATVQTRRDQALHRMQAEAGDTGLCTLARSGQPMPALKYEEGVAATLADLRRRLLRMEPETSEADLLEVICEARTTWREGPAPRLGRTSKDWEAYAAGGDDALSALLDATW